MNKNIFVILGLTVVLAGGLFFLQTSSQTLEKVVITMTETGYSPTNITIKKGQTVVFENKGTKNLWPASNIHPTHGIYPEFDPQKTVAVGESWEFTFDKIGIWRYHDHIYPEITGVITVE
ncbi:MAG: cupredoxin domain-containing protein [bacterium]|nr:cupredoxin domain-containing protein [bacterium]